MSKNNICEAVKKVAVALQFGTAADYSGNNLAQILKQICVNAGAAATTEVIRSNNVADILNYFAENYGAEEHEPYDLNVTKTNATVTVKRNGKNVPAHKDVLYNGDKLVITADPNTGYNLESLTVNDDTFTSGDTFTVDRHNVYVEALGTPKPFDLARSATNCTVSVTNGDIEVSDGEGVIAYGNELVITAVPRGEYGTVTLTVNGEPFTSGETYRVTGDVTIVATAE